ncbi:MAG: xanthine dehydrogenase family protein subunit M, partial [Bacillota bacterium]
GKTLLSSEEILTGVVFPALPPEAGSSFVKLGRRNSLAISRISMAVIVTLAPDESIADARLVLGAVAPRPVRAFDAEALLRGKRPGPALLEEAVASIVETVKTVLGSRASAPYKRIAVRGVAQEALKKAVPAFAREESQ